MDFVSAISKSKKIWGILLVFFFLFNCSFISNMNFYYIAASCYNTTLIFKCCISGKLLKREYANCCETLTKTMNILIYSIVNLVFVYAWLRSRHSIEHFYMYAIKFFNTTILNETGTQQPKVFLCYYFSVFTFPSLC